MERELEQKIKLAVKTLYELDVEPEVTEAPVGVADYASNVAMRLARELHTAPMTIAAEIKTELDKGGIKAEVAAPGFLNFISPDEYFSKKIGEIGKKGVDSVINISQGEYSGKMVVAEFSDPNPFKVLHVGHLYTSIVGDSISRILELAGAKVVRANFGGDVGLHVAKTLLALMMQMDNSVFPEVRSGALWSSLMPSGKDYCDNLDDLTIQDIADAYVVGSKLYEDDEAAKAKIVELNKEIFEISAGGSRDGKLAQLYWRGREISYDYFEKFYARIGVKFDKYYPESTVAGRGLEEVKRGLELGVYEKSDGAVVYKGEKKGLHTRVFINQNGLPTYEAKDVGLIFTKWDDWHFDESVVITGNDIIEYMKVVLASVAEMAPELPERTRHLTHGQVKLPGNEKMSSRKGNFLKAVDVLSMVREQLGGERADEKVVLAAVKYAFLKYKMGGDIIFDPKESVAVNGNSGVYLLYSAVRAKKILSTCGSASTVSSDQVALSSSKESDPRQPSNYDPRKGQHAAGELSKFERELSKKIVQYEGALHAAVAEKAPNKLCTYLYELAQEFSRFYENVKVAGSEREGELAVLVRAYLDVMEHGLGLLGIEVPEEM